MAIEGAAAQPQPREDERDSAALASLMDPAALERRLAQARAQRAAALEARKAAGGTGPAPGGEAPRRPVPLPPRALRPSPEPLVQRGTLASDAAVPEITPVPAPVRLQPLVAERRAPPPERRRALPAGVLIGFAAGAVAALGVVVVIEPRLGLRTWTETAPAAPPSAAPSAAEAAPSVMVAEVVVVAPPLEAPAGAAAGPGPDMPDPTLAGASPVMVALPPTAPGSAEMQKAAGSIAPRQEVPAPVRAAAPAPPEAADSPAAPVAAGVPTGEDTPVVPFEDRDLRLIVHAPTGIPSADIDAALTLLAGAVAPPEGPIGVTYAISTSNVRYYHAADADAAAAAAASLSTRLGPVEARDFTGYQPRPAAGTIEVWLSGAPVTPARTAPAGIASANGDRQAAPPTGPGRAPEAVVVGIPDLVQSVVQKPPVVEGIPGLVESVVQNQAIEAANEARAAAQAEEAARRLDGGIGNALRRALGAP